MAKHEDVKMDKAMMAKAVHKHERAKHFLREIKLIE